MIGRTGVQSPAERDDRRILGQDDEIELAIELAGQFVKKLDRQLLQLDLGPVDNLAI